MNLKEKYKSEVVPAMMKKFNYKSVMQVPKLDKIVINMGVSDVKENSKALDVAMSDLTLIAGQKPMITKARKSIAAFKLREGMNIGCKVTLRRDKMYDFGNYSLGIKEQLIFPEIEYDKVDKARGMDISFVTTAKTDEEAKALLEMLGMPFQHDEK